MFKILRLLLGRPEESAESRLGSLFRTPYFLSVFVNVQKRKGAIVFQNINDHLTCYIGELLARSSPFILDMG